MAVWELYGLKSSGAAFRSFLSETLEFLNYLPYDAEPDVWMRQAVKWDGYKYWEYVLCYVYDILFISHKPEETMKGIQANFKLKDEKVEEHTYY